MARVLPKSIRTLARTLGTREQRLRAYAFLLDYDSLANCLRYVLSRWESNSDTFARSHYTTRVEASRVGWLSDGRIRVGGDGLRRAG